MTTNAINEPKTKQVTFRCPEDIITRLDNILLDPIRGKTKYGARSALLSNLIKEWLDKEYPNVSS